MKKGARQKHRQASFARAGDLGEELRSGEREQRVIRRSYVIQRKGRIVPSVARESGDGMAPLVHHSPSKY
eukprot:6212572-Pleurochrysis_carterae.AAC.1